MAPTSGLLAVSRSPLKAIGWYSAQSRFTCSSPSEARRKSPTSAPELKARPAPVTTIAPTPGSAFSSSVASTHSRKSWPFIAFITSGRAKRTTATRPSRSTSIVS